MTHPISKIYKSFFLLPFQPHIHIRFISIGLWFIALSIAVPIFSTYVQIMLYEQGLLYYIESYTLLNMLQSLNLTGILTSEDWYNIRYGLLYIPLAAPRSELYVLFLFLVSFFSLTVIGSFLYQKKLWAYYASFGVLLGIFIFTLYAFQYEQTKHPYLTSTHLFIQLETHQGNLFNSQLQQFILDRNGPELPIFQTEEHFPGMPNTPMAGYKLIPMPTLSFLFAQANLFEQLHQYKDANGEPRYFQYYFNQLVTLLFPFLFSVYGMILLLTRNIRAVFSLPSILERWKNIRKKSLTMEETNEYDPETDLQGLKG